MENKKQDLKILLVEDDYMVSQTIIRSLKNVGYSNIIEASDGKEAIEMTCSQKPNIILMDIEMPEMNGLDAAKIIQDTCPTPIIIVTAFDNSEYVNQASDSGVSAYLNKPLQEDRIERVIIIAMARHNDLMELRRLNKEATERNIELEKALSEIKTLRGILPICANCHRIRDDKGYWNDVSAYIVKHTEAELTHGICPTCADELYGDQDWYKSMKHNEEEKDK
ncbi:MAG: response regulator [Candidatus Cloacimonadota bacterium]|nr:response regulator [Candidatus Cloacimonadota bacterium]